MVFYEQTQLKRIPCMNDKYCVLSGKWLCSTRVYAIMKQWNADVLY